MTPPTPDFNGILGDTEDRRILIDKIINPAAPEDAMHELAYVLTHLRRAVTEKGATAEDVAAELESMLLILFQRSEYYRLAFELFTHPDHLPKGPEPLRRFVRESLAARFESEAPQ